jgi:hypothetical protein
MNILRWTRIRIRNLFECMLIISYLLFSALSSRERHDNNLPYVVDVQEPDPVQLLNVIPLDCTAKCNNQLFETLRSALEGSTTQVFREFHSMCRLVFWGIFLKKF